MWNICLGFLTTGKRWRRPLSLATRPTFFIGLVTIASFFAFAQIMIHSVKVYFAEQDINDLQEISTTLGRIINQPNKPESHCLGTLRNVAAGYSNVIISLRDNSQKAIFHSPNAPDLRQSIVSTRSDGNAHASDVFIISGPALQASKHIHRQKTLSNWRMIRLPVGQFADGKPAYTLYLALSISFHLHHINDLKNKLVIAASLVNMMIVFIMLFAVYKSREPIRNVDRRIQDVASKDLDVRLDPRAVPIELRQLVSSPNHMIERIKNVFERQSNFSADIAHEIRMSITSLATQTEIALSQTRSQKEFKDVLYSNFKGFGHMSGTVSDMLFLAQADNNQLIPERKAFNLADEVGKAFDFFEAWAEEREAGLRFEGHACWVPGNPLMLRRVMSNLLPNAMRYTPKGESATVWVKGANGQVQIIVENPGNPIPPQHLPRLLDRFYRMNPSRQRRGEGSGIGLAIVKSIVTVHQGKVSVTSDPHATRLILMLPKHAI